MTELTMPNTPKIPLARYLKQAPDAFDRARVQADSAVTVSQTAAAWPVRSVVDAWLGAPLVTEVFIPAGYHAEAPVQVTGPEVGSALVILHVGAGAHVRLQDHWATSGQQLGVGVLLELAANAEVDWLTYDAFTAQTAIVQRTAELAEHAKLNWTVAGFAHNSGASLLTVNLNGTGSQATINVGVLASGSQHVGYTTAMTNNGRQTQGHINQRGVIVGKAHLIFNGIGHIIKGARGSDNQQENRVLMLGSKARGDANPILLIDENDVTAGHAASVTRVDRTQLYYLMSRGLPESLAKRLVIRGFLEAGLLEITDPALKQALFKQIDETLVMADA